MRFTFITSLILFFIASHIFLAIEWFELDQRNKILDKELAQVKKELYDCKIETETFEDIVVNKRWE